MWFSLEMRLVELKVTGSALYLYYFTYSALSVEDFHRRNPGGWVVSSL